MAAKGTTLVLLATSVNLSPCAESKRRSPCHTENTWCPTKRNMVNNVNDVPTWQSQSVGVREKATTEHFKKEASV